MRHILTFLALFLFTGLITPAKSQGIGRSPNMRLEATGLEIGSKLPDSLEVMIQMETRFI